MGSYIRRTSRRATTDARIEDNWVELPTTEFALAATQPAISIPGGKLGVHFGRIGVTLSQAVPHGLSSANAILLGQTARRGSTSSTAGNNWSGFLTPERKGPRTYNAIAVVNNVVSAVAFAPNPGSPRAPSPSVPAKRKTVPKEKWHDLFADNVVQRYQLDSRTGSKGQLAVQPCLAFADDSKTPTSLHRSATLPLPSRSKRESIQEVSQYVVINPRPSGFVDSPLPLSTAFTTTLDLNEDDERTPVGPQAIIEGVDDLCDMAAAEYIQADGQSDTSSTNRYHSFDRMDTPTSISQTSAFHTPMSQTFESSIVERKLLVIGSNYDCETASTFAYRHSLASLKGAYVDAKSLKSAFRQRSYSVQTLVGATFSRDDVLEAVRSFLSSATRPGDVRAIIFTGHTRCTLNDGTVAIVPPVCRGENDLIPADQWERTVLESTMPGVIVLSIFASCMSGALMRQKVDLKDLSSTLPRDERVLTDAPIFVTFASSKQYERSYESTVGFNEDGTSRPGDHFLRALTLTARERNVTDWHSFMQTIQTKFEQLRRIGAYCAELGSNSDVSYQSWLERSPQQPVMSASQIYLPPFESVFPSQISLLEAPDTPVHNPVDIAEEFLAHIRLRGDFPEISHFTYSSTNDVVPPV